MIVKIKKGNINFIKGICMLAILFFHMSQYDYGVNKMLFSVRELIYIMFFGCLDFFAFIYGYNLREENIRSSLKKTYKSLLIPYLFTALVTLMIFPIVHVSFFKWWPGAINEAKKYFFGFLFGMSSSGVISSIEYYSAAVVYYLLSLFWAANITNLIIKIPKTKIQVLSAITCFLLSKIVAYSGFRFYCVVEGLFLSFVCYFGYLFKLKYLNVLKKRKIIIYAIVCLMISAVFVHCNISSNGLLLNGAKTAFVYEIICIINGFFLFLISFFIKCENKLSGYIKLIGVNSPFVMCAHGVELMCFPWYLWGDYCTKNNNIVIGIIVELIARMAIINVITIILKRLYMFIILRVDYGK